MLLTQDGEICCRLHHEPNHTFLFVKVKDVVISETFFKSFIMGGFESACHINSQGRRLDMIGQTQHDIQAEQDYVLVKTQGIQTVRDGVRWPLIEKKPGVYDFSSLEPMAAAAQKQSVQVIWTLCHYGWPDDLDVFSPQFVSRFAAFSKAVALFLSQYSDGIPFFTPVNEISYFCWIGGEVGTVHPYAKERGYEMKAQLVRAVLACMDAIWEVSPEARFVHVEPLINVATPRNYLDLREAAIADHATQFEAYDMIAGVMHPELGAQQNIWILLAAISTMKTNGFITPITSRLMKERQIRIGCPCIF